MMADIDVMRRSVPDASGRGFVRTGGSNSMRAVTTGKSHRKKDKRMDESTKDATIEQLAEYCRSLQRKVRDLETRQRAMTAPNMSDDLNFNGQMLQNSYTPTPASNGQSRLSQLDPFGNSRKGLVDSQRSSGAGTPLDRPLSIREVDNLLYAKMLNDSRRAC